MTDALAPPTTPKKIFKPSSKTKTPTRSRLSPQLTRRTNSPEATSEAARSVASESAESAHGPSLESPARPKKFAPLARGQSTFSRARKPAEEASSDTTGETSTSLADNNVLTPAETASRSTGLRSPFSRANSRNTTASPSSFKDKIARARESAKESGDGLVKRIAGKPAEAVADTASALVAEADNSTDIFNLAKASQSVTDGTNEANSQRDVQPSKGLDSSGSAHTSKTPDGAFRDTGESGPRAQPINKMGEPNVAKISQTAQPTIRKKAKDSKQPSHGAEPDGRNGATHEVDNMGRPAHVERTFEIPFQRPAKEANSPLPSKKQRSESQDLGDFEDLPGVETLPSTDDLPGIPQDDSEDPPEEILDPSVHSRSSSSITPIPKIPKIPHIDSSPPANLQRLAQGLAGHVVDDVGNIVDESGEVLGHATGDLPAMVGKKVADDGEVYGDGGEIVGYVSTNFVNPPSPTEIPGDILGGLRIDHEGNILDSDDKIIGKFYQQPKRKGPDASSHKTGAKNKSEGEQKPKVNAHTGGSPSDLFLDVKSTTDGIQLTIRIPTTFSRPPPESE
ncbi:hypothetical protein F4777DRAFT_591459 [Nemania sp. FL0916]|nr:hypothetical protein F4777DRAFT_591459 [Nemania sp. FL0916]